MTVQYELELEKGHNESFPKASNSEVTVILKNEDCTFKHKFLVYQAFEVYPGDVFLQKLVRETKELAKFEPDEVTVKINMVL